MVQVGEHLLYQTVKQYMVNMNLTDFVCVSNTNKKVSFSKTQNNANKNTIAIGENNMAYQQGDTITTSDTTHSLAT